MVIIEDIDNWYSIQPQSEDDWVSLVEGCVIRDDYEDWHIDKVMIMEVLKNIQSLNLLIDIYAI